MNARRRHVPYNDHCPSCSAVRTFTLLGFEGEGLEARVGCCVCGWSAADPAVTVQTLAAELAEVRDELHDLATLVRRGQTKPLLQAVADMAGRDLCPTCAGRGRGVLDRGPCSLCGGAGSVPQRASL